MRKKLIIIVCALFSLSCKQQAKQKPASMKTKQTEQLPPVQQEEKKQLLVQMGEDRLYYSQETVTRREVLSYLIAYSAQIKNLEGKIVEQMTHANKGNCENHILDEAHLGKNHLPFYKKIQKIINKFVEKEKNKCANKNWDGVPDAITKAHCNCPLSKPNANCFKVCNVFLTKKIPQVGEKIHVFFVFNPDYKTDRGRQLQLVHLLTFKGCE